MSKEYKLPPSARSLSSSMRDIGYSLETAIADIIDNSISANSTEIGIFCEPAYENLCIAIIDNGEGMDEEDLIRAMRHGGGQTGRRPTDLGRFGLGLKTASFSQCRNLTVISARGGELCGAEWDLDTVEEKDDWVIGLLDQSEICKLPFVEKLGTDGTLILWRKIDRLHADTATPDIFREMMNESLDILGNHLSLVFHRYMEGEFSKRGKLSISINGHPLQPFDPFCRKYGAQWTIAEEKIDLGAEEVEVNVYILPHYSRISPQVENYYKSRSDFLSNQGIYIYRNGRLMVWGDWFRLMPRKEATKLVRVQVDFPTALDDLWQIDIKKSRATLPHPVRERLKQLRMRITEQGKRPYKKRLRNLSGENLAPVWERYRERDGIHYEINRTHPLVVSLMEKLPEDQAKIFETILSSIGASLPFANIYDDFSDTPRLLETENCTKEEIQAKLDELRHALFGDGPIDREIFMDVAQSISSTFGNKMSVVEKYLETEK